MEAMAFDMTKELAPLIYGLNAAFIASALGVLLCAAAPWMRTFDLPPVSTWLRPVLAGR